MQLLEQTAVRTGKQGSEPICLSFLPLCSSLAVSVLYSGAVTTEQGTTETWTVLALSPRSLNKPGTIMFTTVFPAYRFVNLVAFLSSPFNPCWFLAAGIVCCEDQPLDPVGIFHPETIFAEQQLECKKNSLNSKEVLRSRLLVNGHLNTETIVVACPFFPGLTVKFREELTRVEIFAVQVSKSCDSHTVVPGIQVPQHLSYPN